MQQDVIFGMLLTILNKDKVTASYLAEKYYISTRTVYRYLDVLNLNGIPIVSKSGRNGGISILNGFKLNRLYFTAPEKVQLLSLLHLVPNENIKNSLIEKINLI